jgi:beta-ureidopropionase / N-carbamoyl-L-amino-acid hydrolase
MNTSILRINADRLKANFEALCQFGATPRGGVHRPAFSPEHIQARAWFRQKAEQASLKFTSDSAGNHSAILECAGAGKPHLLLGSHLDSVPDGGRFDGAIGVLAAFEVLQTVKEAGLKLPVNLEAIDFTDEEGTLIGLMGSSAAAGKLTCEELDNPRGGRQNLLSGLARAGLSAQGLLQAKRDPRDLAGYLEVHIEQGQRLTSAGVQIGVVSSIVGLGSYWLTFIGRADHAGTTPMKSRLDASQGASAYTLAVRDTLLREFPDCVANIGQMSIEPGAFNIVPAKVTLALEYRAPNAEGFSKLETHLLDLAQRKAEKFGLELETQFLGKKNPAQMHPAAQDAIRQAAKTLDLGAVLLVSYAGHDAQSLAALCPAGMIFIPSVNGTSHSPLELTPWEDCVNGANLLLHAALEIAKGRFAS